MQSSFGGGSSRDSNIQREVDAFDNREDTVPNAKSMAENAQNIKENVFSNSHVERTDILQTENRLVSELTELAARNPQRADDHNSNIDVVRDAATEAIKKLDENTNSALEYIDQLKYEQSNQVLFLIIGETVLAECLLGFFVIVLNLVTKFYFNVTFRNTFKLFYTVYRCKLTNIVTK